MTENLKKDKDWKKKDRKSDLRKERKRWKWKKIEGLGFHDI